MLTQKEQIFDQIKKANNILITFSSDWSGDAVSSALALFLFLNKLDKKVTIVADPSSKGSLFSFLPNFNVIQDSLSDMRNFIISLNIKDTQVDRVKYKTENNRLKFIITPKSGAFKDSDIETEVGTYNFDLVFALDAPDLESLGSIYENNADFFYKVPVINIDNHSGNEEFGQINHIEITSISTTEVLYSLMNDYSEEIIDEQIATCLLTGMIDKTRSFRTQNVTPNSLEIASNLFSIGADRDLIVNKLYRSRSLGVLKLWGRVLARLVESDNGQIVWSIINENDFTKTNTTKEDLFEVIDELMISMPSAKVIVLLYEDIDRKTNQKITRSIVYSVRNIDTLNLVKEFDPVGTKKTVKITLNMPIKDAESKLITHISEKVKRLPIN